ENLSNTARPQKFDSKQTYSPKDSHLRIRHASADAYFAICCQVLGVSAAVAEEAFEHIQTIEMEQTIESGSARAIIATCLALVARYHHKHHYYLTTYKDMFEAMDVPYDEVLQVREEVLREIFPGWLSWNIGEDDPLWPTLSNAADLANRSLPMRREKIKRYKDYCQEKARKEARGPSLTEKLDTLFGIRLSPDDDEGTEKPYQPLRDSQTAATDKFGPEVNEKPV
ncbi:MAG: hypothetical protein Q9183_006416, partial [Haloplaca sp. 2 TL-2023]